MSEVRCTYRAQSHKHLYWVRAYTVSSFSYCGRQ